MWICHYSIGGYWNLVKMWIWLVIILLGLRVNLLTITHYWNLPLYFCLIEFSVEHIIWCFKMFKSSYGLFSLNIEPFLFFQMCIPILLWSAGSYMSEDMFLFWLIIFFFVILLASNYNLGWKKLLAWLTILINFGKIVQELRESMLFLPLVAVVLEDMRLLCYVWGWCTFTLGILRRLWR